VMRECVLYDRFYFLHVLVKTVGKGRKEEFLASLYGVLEVVGWNR
jgi:hypothetical protein